jgi:hypothetical protein
VACWARVALALAATLVAAPAASADVVTDWNKTMIEAQAVANTPAPPGARIAAIVQASVFDAVNGITPRYNPVHVAPAAPAGASRDAAAAGAAHEALMAFYPDQKALLDEQLAISIGMLDASQQSITDGMNWGMSVADQIVAWRASDGSASVLPPYVAGGAPGDWAPTPPAFVTPPLFRAVGVTTPFGMTSADQFRPAGPPALTSAAYAAAFNEVKEMGSFASTTRTDAQTFTARFWASDSPIGVWNRVALRLMARHQRSLLQEAHTLALLNMSLADGAIAVWEAKNHFDTWRPITAIQQADTDGNPATAADPTWHPLMPTPPFQEYPSGHVGVSSSGVNLLQIVFGRTPISVTSVAYPGLVRSYPGANAVLNDIADARTFAGFHFRFASTDAKTMGWKIARQDWRALARPMHHHHRR